jgi:hypothetical protein
MKLAPRPGLIIYLFFFGCSSFSSSSYADSCEETVQEVALNQGYIEKVMKWTPKTRPEVLLTSAK